MKVVFAWLALGAAGAFLVAAVLSVSLGGPGWPYFLFMGAACILGALVTLLWNRPDRTD